MNGVIAAPFLAAVLIGLITGSGTAAGVTFLVVLGVAALAIAGEFKRQWRGR